VVQVDGFVLGPGSPRPTQSSVAASVERETDVLISRGAIIAPPPQCHRRSQGVWIKQPRLRGEDGKSSSPKTGPGCCPPPLISARKKVFNEIGTLASRFRTIPACVALGNWSRAPAPTEAMMGRKIATPAGVRAEQTAAPWGRGRLLSSHTGGGYFSQADRGALKSAPPSAQPLPAFLQPGRPGRSSSSTGPRPFQPAFGSSVWPAVQPLWHRSGRVGQKP